MSLIQNLEIDTLRLRNLLVRNPDNTTIPSSFQLYSRGDGKTYWSTGVDAQQFINLSSQVSSNTTRISTLVIQAFSTFQGGLSTLSTYITSTLFGFSTVAINADLLSTVEGLDQLTFTLSGELISTQFAYTTLDSTNALSTQINSSILSTSQTSVDNFSTLSSYIQTTNLNLYLNVSTLYVNINSLSTNVGSTISTIFLYQSDLWVSTKVLNATTASSLRADTTDVALAVVNNKAITDAYPSTISGVASTLSTAIRQGDLSTLSAAIGFTSSLNASTVSSFNSGLSSLNSTFQYKLDSSVQSLQSSISTVDGRAISTFQFISTATIGAVSTLSSNINILLSTSLIANIYATFIELQSSSAKEVTDAISSNSGFLNSTVSSFTFIYDSTLSYINTSTYNFLVGAAYTSSVSTVVPYTISTTNAVVASSVSTFNSTISVQSSSFSTSMGVTLSTFVISVNQVKVSTISTISSYLFLISSNAASTIINLSSFLSSAISTISSLTKTDISLISTDFYGQFVLSSVTMWSGSPTSTLNNVSTVLALPSVIASIVNLDLSAYDNYYINLSDIRSDVYYGMTYSTTALSTFSNRDITLQIDIRSTYSNQYFVFDTSHFSDWLSTQQIYNPKSFKLLTNDASFIVPTPDTTQQIFISTFVGAYIVNFRLAQNTMYLKSVDAYPYIYSNVAISTITIPANVQSTDGPTQTNNFLMFSGSEMPITWTTNDLNIPLGFKFVGTDFISGRTVISWSGPYSSATRSANVKVPPAASPFVRYNTVYLGIYPNSATNNNTSDGNIVAPGQVFAASTFGKTLGVVSPTLNSRVTVQNPGTISRFLQVAEIWIYNAQRENIVTDKFNTYASMTKSGSVPYETNYAAYGPDRAFDGNLSTYFQGGIDGTTNYDFNARVFCTMSTFASTYTSSVFISSVAVFGSGVTSLSGMQVKYETFNLPPGILNSFFSTMTITSTTQQTFMFA